MKDIDYDIADVIIERPQEFKIGRKSFKLYPVTLAKMFLLKRQIDGLSISASILKVNPYLEAIRIAKENREVCCHVLAYHTAPNTYKDLYNTQAIITRKNYFAKSLNEEELASLMILVLTADKTDEILSHYGLDKEKERLHKVMEVKNKSDKNNLTFNGVSLFGTFIGQLKEMGFTTDEILFERGYTFLRLMLADKVVNVLLTDEERGQLYASVGGSLMDASDPNSAEKIKGFFAKKGIEIK